MRSTLLFTIFFLSVYASAQEKTTALKNSIELSQQLFDEKLYDSSYAIIDAILDDVMEQSEDSLVLSALIQKLRASSEVNPSSVDSLYDAIVKRGKNAEQWDLLAQVFFTRGRIFYRARDFGKAQIYFLKVDSLASQHKMLNETVIRAILARSEISRTTFTYEGVEKASELQDEALILSKQIENEELIYDIYTRLADMNGLKGNLPEVRKYLDLAFPYFFAKKDVVQLHRLFFTEKSYYYDLEDFTKAEETIKKSIDYFLGQNAQEELASSYVSYGNFFRKKRNDCLRAIPQFKKAQAIYDRLDQKLSDRYMYLVEGMALCEAANGNYKEAYEYYQETYLTKKQLVKNANNDLTRQLETKYQSEKKRQEIELLKSQNELAEQQKTNQRNLLLGGLGLTTLAGVFLFIGFRNRKKVNDKLRELDATKSNFFANISHEFRTPLALIAGPIETQLQKENLSQEEKYHLQTAQRNSKRLLVLVDQLLDLSKLESGHFNLKIQQGDLGLFIKSIASLFEYQVTEKNQTYESQVRIPNKSYYFDTDALEKIITNLLANAIKYSPEKASIQLEATVENGTLKLTIKNSGVSLPQNVIDTLFNRFERADETVTGSGIGLALTKELVEIHKGTITVTNENDWMQFSIILPVKAAAYTPDELSEGQIAITKYDKTDPAFAKAETQTPIIEEEKDIFYKDTSPILLIVDDNEDLREYVSSLFKDQYAIHTAHNGKKGFEIAQDMIPDLIITDLMMPGEDGLKFTKNCKSAEATSHIPIIMLTAKASDENLLEGLETGADAYITKPFSTEVLKHTVHNLLENRRKLQERFSQEVVLFPKDLASNSMEERFLGNLKTVLEEKLIESDFNTEDFAKALGMSRMQLHRKLKALTGLSATEFVRSQRLKLAAQMLKKSDINVSQVGYAVGFNNHSYFTKCFKEQYGVSPSEYAKRS